MRFAFSATGGISYHLIARRRARSLWTPFRLRVRGWVEEWMRGESFHVGVAVDVAADVATASASAARRSRELVVFGPSAGWTLPLDLFADFKRVIFVEPDPVARFLLRRRLPSGVRAEFISRADLLPWTSTRPGIFAEFLARYPGAAVLFSNVLGQVPLIAKRSGSETNAEFLAALESRDWASYHDLFSGSAIGADMIASRDPSKVFKRGDVVDHETSWLTNDLSQLALWPLTEKTLHVIEFVQS